MSLIAQNKMHWPELRLGTMLDGSPIEAVNAMHAMVYFGKGDYRVIPNRPVVCTAHDMIAQVLLVHRCGTDVKIYQSGRPDQAEESLLQELARLVDSTHDGDSRQFLKYVRLMSTGEADPQWSDGLYMDLAARLAGMTGNDRNQLWKGLHLYWGRIFGHETVVRIVRVGSKVHELTRGIGYLQGRTLNPKMLNYQVGEICTLQSRIAHYQPALFADSGSDTAGVQLLGGNITDLAMNQAGAFAQYVRLRPQVIQSGSVLRVPQGLDHVSAALVEPLACLLDCFEKTTHELGQDAQGSILRKGVMPGGLTLIIGSGSMAMMAGKLALMDDPKIRIGNARQVVFVVRSQAKRELVQKIMNDSRVACVVCDQDQQIPEAIACQFQPTQDPYGRKSGGFDDVILAAGSAKTVGVAHQLLTPTGGRIMTFAGTRGPVEIESGFWHYGNAGVLGTSGCNTRMMEVALALLGRGSIDLKPLSGRTYSFSDLAKQDGCAAFFEDQYLRPKLDPQAGLEELLWS